MFIVEKCSRPGIIVLFGALLAGTAAAQIRNMAPPEFISWLPITPAEQQMKSPVVDKEAGAEILLYRVHVMDDFVSSGDIQRVFYHYVRLKVFDEKGKESASTIDLTYGDRTNIMDVQGHTIKADGSMVELDKKSIYKRDLVRVGRARQKAVSFAMPGVEAGSIIEYRWREIIDDPRIMYLRLRFQREFPAQKVTYFVRPLPSEYAQGYRMRIMPFNAKISPLKLENDGYNSTSVENVPAVQDEPYAPSEPNVTAWALLFYQRDNREDADKYWAEVGKKGYQQLKAALKINDEMKTAAAEAVANAKDDEAKTNALIALTRKNIRYLFDNSVTEAERNKYIKDLPKDRRITAAEIFKKGLGTSDDMNVVFAALAQQIGLEARPAWVASRSEVAFAPKRLVDDYFLGSMNMAVKAGDSWKVIDVGTRLLPPGMISWSEEGVPALLGDPKAPSFLETPNAPPEASAESRVARLKLTPEGSLEGDVEESYTGHRAEDYRRQLNGKSLAQQEEWLHERVTKLFPGSEVTAMKVENVDDASKELKASYHMDAPRFAQSTGKRMLFHTNPFRRSQASPFTSSERKFTVEFPYAWKEADDVHIKLPLGWRLDHGDSPASMNFGEPGSYDVKLEIKNDNELFSSRQFVFGRGGMLYFRPEGYGSLKKVFDEIQRRDGHSLSIVEDQ